MRGKKLTQKKETVKFDIKKAIKIADDTQDFFKKKKIEPMGALLAMMILSEAIKRFLKLQPEDYQSLLDALEKVK